MHYSFAVHVLQGTGDLVDVLPNLSLGKSHLIFLRSLHDQLEVSFLGPLDGDEQFVELIVDEPV